MSFENLRKKSASMIDAINKAKQKPSQENSKQADTRFWRPTLDDAKNANAVIRFLPPAEGEDNPFVRTYSHGFKAENGRWYIEESLTTIGQPDPVYVWNDKVWKLGHDAAKKLVRDRKRKEHFISNILVINDPASPENNGKVFLYKYGKQIFDKIHAKLNPEFDDQTRINVFDLWEGANFRLRVKQKDRHITFEFSEFDGISELFGGDETKLRQLYSDLYPLLPFIDPANFKPYDVLEKRFFDVIEGDPDIQEWGLVIPSTYAKNNNPTTSNGANPAVLAQSNPDDELQFDLEPTKATVATPKVTNVATSKVSNVSSDDDDDFWNSLNEGS